MKVSSQGLGSVPACECGLLFATEKAALRHIARRADRGDFAHAISSLVIVSEEKKKR